MEIVQGESGGWIVAHGGKTLWSGYETEEAARDAADQGIARMFKNRSERMLKLIEMTTNPGVPGWLIDNECKLIRQALEEIEARWGSPSPEIDAEIARLNASPTKDGASHV